MVLKPGILGALIALVVALLVGLAIGALAQRRSAGATPALASTR